MLQVLLISLTVNFLVYTGTDGANRYKGNQGVVRDTGETVCIIKDHRSSFLIRRDDLTRERVKKKTVKVLDELCI